MNYGLTKGTRHYIQFQLTDEVTWQDLLFQNAEGDLAGLWCSRTYSAANARIEQLMTECDTPRENYRIVKRTWQEEILVHDPNHGKAYNDPGYYDPAADPDNEKIVEIEDKTMEMDLEAQVGEVPDTGDDSPQFEIVNDGPDNPLVK